MHPKLTVAISAARRAGNMIMRANQFRKRLHIEEKGHHDFVTETDRKAEEAIVDILHEAYPTHNFLTEETGSIQYEDNEKLWIIDPLDGTTNFIHGFPNFAISIAYQYRGVTELGLVYNPVTQDIFTAAKGAGAQLNDKRIRVSDKIDLEGSLISAAPPGKSKHLNPGYARHYAKLQQISAGNRHLGAVSLYLAYVAAGFLDAYWNTKFKIWDIAAGALLIREAGGVIIDFNGDLDVMKTGTLIAANPKMTHQVLQSIKPFVNFPEETKCLN